MLLGRRLPEIWHQLCRPRRGRDDCCWDFSELADNGVFDFHVKDTLNFQVLTGHDDITYYRVDNDSLLEVGTENPLVMTHYDKPVGRLVFPIAYKDSAASDFETTWKNVPESQ